MERKIDVTNKSVLGLLSKTTDYLQPNPASRAKLNMLNTMSKIRGQVKTTGYPQAEGLLGDCMLRHGQDLGEDSIFGCALTDVGEAMRQVAHVKDSLDISVKQNFIDPLQHLQDKDLKEITHHLKKLEGRRLDLDYKKKRQGKIPDEEIRQAVEKFDESRELAERSMFHFLENDHGCSWSSAGSPECSCYFSPGQINGPTLPQYSDHFTADITSVPLSWPETPTANGFIRQSELLDQPCCRSLYGFEPENQGELGFKEGDIIILANQIDENWYEGTIHGESGFFPISYVEVLVPLPQ
ncbi:endophilin-A3-like [Pseudochaenichthys georgianus]|uniref:endophilin-A3-like n=1 Tax=Pseudochaenichthys georgianus TaxID=52239 RepID=UPI00146D7BBD|nr:endophilin-A3-like [Pseudochaenichthys georgianus]